MTYIAIATDDGNTVRFGHFGDAEQYLIYEIDPEGNAFLVTKRDNPYIDDPTSPHRQHNQPEKAGKILELLHDCRVFVGHSMGTKNRQILQAHGVLPLALRRRNVPVAEALTLAKQALREEPE